MNEFGPDNEFDQDTLLIEDILFDIETSSEISDI